MTYAVKRVLVHQSSLTLALLYGILGVIYVPILLLANTASSSEEQIPGIVIWLMPVILCLLSYVMMAIMFALYNGLAKLTGGVAFTLSGVPGAEGTEGS